MGLDFKLDPLDCDPFYHGYGMNCSDAELTIGIWRLPLTDVKGNDAEISFYITKGNGILLLGNSVLANQTSSTRVASTRNLVLLPPDRVAGLKTEVALPTYTTTDDGMRTRLHVVPSQCSQFKSYFASYKSLYSSKVLTGGSDRRAGSRVLGKSSKDFATRLHMYTHMSLRDMLILCKRGGILTPVLKQALSTAIRKCCSCQTTGKPLNVRNISLNKLLRTFNDDLHVDYMWIMDLTPDPILHFRDSSTGLCAAVRAPSRDMDVAARLFEMHWVNVHGSPAAVSADLEFDNDDFRAAIFKHGASFNPRPARKHSKMGSVESANFTLRVMAQRLLKDAENSRVTKGIGFTVDEVISKAVFLVNVLHGQKELSAFELARGYTPALSGLPQTIVDQDLVAAQQEQIARRALQKMLKSLSPRVVPQALLPKGTPVYFFEKRTKHGVWSTGFVQEAKEHFLELSRNKSGCGKRLKVAYEDVRLFPSSSLLHELDQLELHANEEQTANESEDGRDSAAEEAPVSAEADQNPGHRYASSWCIE